MLLYFHCISGAPELWMWGALASSCWLIADWLIVLQWHHRGKRIHSLQSATVRLSVRLKQMKNWICCLTLSCSASMIQRLANITNWLCSTYYQATINYCVRLLVLTVLACSHLFLVEYCYDFTLSWLRRLTVQHLSFVVCLNWFWDGASAAFVKSCHCYLWNCRNGNSQIAKHWNMW